MTTYSALKRIYLDMDKFHPLQVELDLWPHSGNFNSNFLLDTPKPVSYT
jgi:hypothetical protein